MTIEEYLNKPYWVIDILPKQVPADGRGQYFRNLKAVFKVYQMDYPDYRFYDTLTASRRQFGHSLPNHQLQTVAAACGYDLQNHHHALADAEACAAIALYLLE